MKNLLLISLVLSSGFAFADCDEGECQYYPPKNSPQNQSFITKAQAAKIAAEAVGGGFVKDIDFERGFTGTYYEIEVLDNKGREYEVNVDAKTGKVLSKRRDW